MNLLPPNLDVRLARSEKSIVAIEKSVENIGEILEKIFDVLNVLMIANRSSVEIKVKDQKLNGGS
jgi:acetolactate synthase small subunit